MTSLDHIRDRDQLVADLLAEIVGPKPTGEAVDATQPIILETLKESFRPFRQAANGDEILTADRPTKRYGAGVLFPYRTVGEDGGVGVAGGREEAGDEDESELQMEDREDPAITERASDSLQRIASREGQGAVSDDDEPLDLTAANQFKPSVMALSFLCAPGRDGVLKVAASGGAYTRTPVTAGDALRHWWVRREVSVEGQIDSAALHKGGLLAVVVTRSRGVGSLLLSLEVRNRPRDDGTTLVTVCLVNRTPPSDHVDDACLFQSRLVASIATPDGRPAILPYPTRNPGADLEELGLALLYRKVRTFAVGHGCSADWVVSEDPERAHGVAGVALPIAEIPNITPEIRRPDGSPITVSMAALAGLDATDDGFGALAEVVSGYESWITAREEEATDLLAAYREAAAKHLGLCRDTAGRMRAGLEYLRRDPVGLEAFRLANRAILVQQMRSRRAPRAIRFDAQAQRYLFDEAFQPTDELVPAPGQGEWRPFQVAFLLLAIISTADVGHADRELVELIWFPTGGGKTEAYLGLAAFSMFYRRLRCPTDTGVDVMMRYTLRLLTAQQFQRASRLVCAMEVIRRTRGDLGTSPFSIGIWLGTSITPNSRADALSELRGLLRGRRSAKDWLVVRQCPWCGAEMGVIRHSRARPWPEAADRAVGYRQAGDRVEVRCPDRECDFRDGLPVTLVDEDLYSDPPSMVIGTVDKFAMLAWRPEARALFGLAADGTRSVPPPNLVIQDELHLISGPLGSMVGLYEALVEDLATDRRTGQPVRPKIVCSTATIRRFADQVRALYARQRAALFPPPALDAGDSYFARHARDVGGALLPGKVFVGVHAPGLASMPTAQVRTFSSLLQSPMSMSTRERDPWWTLLVFYNSLRELGTALSLLQSDIPDYLRTIRVREALSSDQGRWLNEVQELTGRLRDEEVPQAIELLERTSSDRFPVDVCVASNIIEVGIDIDRLSLLVVVGQPKATAQYIQVTGRVGRRWWERPGLVVTIYSPSKPRDRSHFEQFRSYHERLYAQVEPTSVTPLSTPALERALHAVMAAYVRQGGDRVEVATPYPAPTEQLERFRDLMLGRGLVVDPDELDELRRTLEQRISEWHARKRTIWEDRTRGEDAPLLHEAGQYVPPSWRGLTWATPLSMRTVDAECEATVSQLYLTGEEAHD